MDGGEEEHKEDHAHAFSFSHFMYNPAHQSRLSGHPPRTLNTSSTGTKRSRTLETPSDDCSGRIESSGMDMFRKEEEKEDKEESDGMVDEEKDGEEEHSLPRLKRQKQSEMGDKKGCIQEIDSSSVHNITSGQVILEPASIVKELVENSLDAGATNIEVIVKDHGMSLIQVSDNGHGIPKDDFQAISMAWEQNPISPFSIMFLTICHSG
jgi:hypothetical protein